MTRPIPLKPPGIRIAGTGSYLPPKKLTNADLMTMMDTTDEWIVQRTGIRERRISDPAKGETTHMMAAEAVRRALADAHLTARDIDLVICATMTPEMTCPPASCMIANLVGTGPCAAYDFSAACCSWVFALNSAAAMIQAGGYSTVALVGADRLSKHVNYSTAGRGTAIIFGDAAAAVILRATDDPSKGPIAKAMHTNADRWHDIYIPNEAYHFPPGATPDEVSLGRVRMNGSAVFKFAVTTFPNLIQETLDKAGLKADDVDMFVCHQSNARILTAARERFHLPEEKLYVNIDRVGNTVSASVPLCLDELRRSGRLKDGQKVMFVAFGGGLTWGSSLWQL